MNLPGANLTGPGQTRANFTGANAAGAIIDPATWSYTSRSDGTVYNTGC